MKRHVHTALKAIGIVAVLGIVGNSVSLAATGQGFILGKTNKANKVTSLQRTTNGPVLNLRNRNAGAAPLTVNGRGLVKNLNADRLDGLHANAFARAGALTQADQKASAAQTTADNAAAAAAQADAKATQAATAAGASDAKAQQAIAAGVETNTLANDAYELGLEARTGVDKMEPQMPIVQALVDIDGTPQPPSRGIAAVQRPATGEYRIQLRSGAYSVNDHIAQVTPLTPACIARTWIHAGSGSLLVEFTDLTGTAKNCVFHLTVTKIIT